MKKLLFSSVVLSVVSLFAVLSALAFDVTSYVDGLSAQWDGLVRADGDTTLDAQNHYHWTDLIGGCVFTLTNATVEASGFYFTGGNPNQGKGSYGVLSLDDTNKIFRPDSKKVTVEVVVTYAGRGRICSLRSTSASGISVGMSGYDKTTGIATFALTGHSYEHVPAVASYPQATEVVTNTFTATYDNAVPQAFYIDGVEVPFDPDGDLSLGKVSSMNQAGTYVGAAQSGSYSGKQTVFAVRVYDRILTEDEIQANVLVDQERFQGIKTATCEVKATTDGEAAMFDTVVTPPFGVSVVTPGASQTFSIADAMADYADGVRAFAAGEGHRVFFKDATVQDGTAASTTETSETFAHQIVGDDTYVTWNFTNEQYLVETTVEGLGTVSETNKWCSVKDGTVQLTAVAGKDRKFISWSGDTEGIADLTSPTIDIPVTQARKLVATFKIQLDPHDVYPTDYTFISDGWTGGTVPAGGASDASELEARFRSANERCVGDFDPDQVLGLLLLVH